MEGRIDTENSSMPKEAEEIARAVREEDEEGDG